MAEADTRDQRIADARISKEAFEKGVEGENWANEQTIEQNMKSEAAKNAGRVPIRPQPTEPTQT